MSNKKDALFKIHYNLDVNFDGIMGETINFISDVDALAYKYNGSVYMMNEIMYPDEAKKGVHVSKILGLTELNDELCVGIKNFIETGKDFKVSMITYASPKTIIVTLNDTDEALDETYDKMYDQIIDNIGISSEEDIDEYILCEMKEPDARLTIIGDDNGGFTCIGLYKNYSFKEMFIEKDVNKLKFDILSNDEKCKLLYED